MSSSSVSKQFSDPRLVAAYDSLNALGDDSEFFCNLVKRLSPKTIIDLGCGTGLLTCELAKRGYTMIGIEPSSAMLDIARRKPHANNVEWIEGSYEKFRGFQVDLILMTSHVSQFFLKDTDWQTMLSTAYKALSPGGNIVFDSRPPNFPPYSSWPTKGSPRRVQDPDLGPIDWYYNLLAIEGNRVRYELHFHFISSGDKIFSTDELIFRSQQELTRSLEKDGFLVEDIFGNWDGSPVTSVSPEMIFVASRSTEKSRINR